MLLPDVNVLVYAFRSDTAQHAVCKHWLDTTVEGRAPFGISPLALAAVVRSVTNPKTFRIPSRTEEAFGFCDDLLGQPHCEIVVPGERHWEIFQSLCSATGTRGPGTTDAWYAALAIERGCTWITFDRDFARFPDLDWRLPVA